MAWSLVQHNVGNTGAGTSAGFSYGSNVTAGNLLVILIALNTSVSQTFSITDGQSNTWVPLLSAANSDATTNQTVMALATVASASGSLSPTVSWSTSDQGSNFGDIMGAEFSGAVPTSIVVDGTQRVTQGTTSSTTVSSPTYTPSFNGTLVINLIGVQWFTQSITGFSTPWSAGEVFSATVRSQAGWGWTTGTASTPLTSNATAGSSSSGYDSVIFGIKALGATGAGAGPFVNGIFVRGVRF